MDSTIFDQELAVNRRAYESMSERIRRDYAGQYVAIAHGRVITASSSFDEAVAAIQKLRPAPEHFLVFPADQGPMFDIILSY